MTAGRSISIVSRPPSISRVTVALPASMATFEANVACGQPSSAASIWPTWFESSSIACLPSNTSCGCSLSTSAFNSFATASGCNSTSVLTRMERSAPVAIAVRSVSWHASTPHETAITSVAAPASFRRTASSTLISSNGFIESFTLAMSTALPSAFTRTLTFASTTRLTGTSTFIAYSIWILRTARYAPSRRLGEHAVALAVEHVDQVAFKRLFRRCLRYVRHHLQPRDDRTHFQLRAARAEYLLRVEMGRVLWHHGRDHILLAGCA